MFLDPLVLRRDFPILDRQINGKPLVYLDSAASSQKPKQVIEAMTEYYYHHHANVHRGAHTLASEATQMYEAARCKVAGFIGATDPASVVFTRNTTEAMNLVAYSWARTNLVAGDEIVVTEAEHHANLVPWHQLVEERDVRLRVVGLSSDHRTHLEAFQEAITKRTRLVSTWHMSNVLGAINPIEEIADIAHAVGALLLVDGAQAVPHLPVNVESLGADFYAISGHKMCGPTGIGALWAKPEILREMPPFMGGGEMIERVALEASTYADIPTRFEAGTPSIAEAIGFGAAVDYLETITMEAIAKHDAELVSYALNSLKAIDGITLYGPEGADRGGIVAFNVEGVHPHDVATALDQEGIAVRAGKHCAHPLMDALEAPSMVRASFYFYNTETEIDQLSHGLQKAHEFFTAFS